MLTREDILSKSNTIEGWFSDGDMDILYNLADKYIEEGGVVCEVGSWKGKSASILGGICQNRNATLYCVDTFFGLIDPKTGLRADIEKNETGSFAEGKAEDLIFRQIQENLIKLPVIYVIGDSSKVYTQVPDGLCFCFIDGDHWEPVVSQDMKNFWGKMKKGGLFCGHDYSTEANNEVKQAVDNFFGEDKITQNATIFSIEKT